MKQHDLGRRAILLLDSIIKTSEVSLISCKLCLVSSIFSRGSVGYAHIHTQNEIIVCVVYHLILSWVSMYDFVKYDVLNQ